MVDKKIVEDTILIQGTAKRVVDFPEFYDGGYTLVSGKALDGGEYAKSAWAFACISIRGEELANLPWQITRNGKVIEKHEVINLLTQFGEESNYAEVIAATEAADGIERDADRLDGSTDGT